APATITTGICLPNFSRTPGTLLLGSAPLERQARTSSRLPSIPPLTPSLFAITGAAFIRQHSLKYSHQVAVTREQLNPPKLERKVWDLRMQSSPPTHSKSQPDQAESNKQAGLLRMLSGG